MKRTHLFAALLVSCALTLPITGCKKDTGLGYMEINAQDFSFSIPGKYQVKETTAFQEQMDLYRDADVRSTVKEIEAAAGKRFDPNSLKQYDARVYELTMGKHELSISLRRNATGQSDLKEYVESELRKEGKEVEEYKQGDLTVQRYGDFSTDLTWIAWMFKKGDSRADIHFQGKGRPSDVVKRDIASIIDSFKFKPSNDAL